ncbi:membrane associated protein [Cryptosporidium felis]|nr:membrane associated protein [Cryptosporidium felis]
MKLLYFSGLIIGVLELTFSDENIINIDLLTQKIDTNLYTNKINVNEMPETREVVEEEPEEKDEEQLESKISQEIINTLRVNWELGLREQRIQVQWELLILIFKADIGIKRPKGMKLIESYKECLFFVKDHSELLLSKGLPREEKVLATQRACVIFFDNYWKIRREWSNIGAEDYLGLFGNITSSQLFLRWREFYKIDPPRSQWFILRKLAINKWEEIFRILRILTKDEKEYMEIENILTEFMTQFSYFYSERQVDERSSREQEKCTNKNKILRLFKRGGPQRKKRIFKIYLPEEMPDIYLYHHGVTTCVLNLSIMSLYPELKVFFYNVFKRNQSYYIFHRKSISVSRKTLLRSNQLCNIMLELTKRLERLHYLLGIRDRRLGITRIGSESQNSTELSHLEFAGSSAEEGLLKPLPSSPYYYSLPSNLELEVHFTNWLFDSDKEGLIKALNNFSKKETKKYRDMFLEVKLDLLKKWISEDKQKIVTYTLKEEKMTKDGLYLGNIHVRINRLLNISEKYSRHLQGKNLTIEYESMLGLEFRESLMPSFYSLIPLIYLNSKLWRTQKFFYSYPVSVQVNLRKMTELSETIKVRKKRLKDIGVREISTCIKIIAVIWKHGGLKVNNRGFRIIDPDEISESYEKSEDLSKVYQDYATLYLLCVKTVSQGVLYYRRILKFCIGPKLEKLRKLNEEFDMNNGKSSNNFQYISEKNLNLHSLPNDFIMPKITKGTYISILAAYVLLSIGALCIQTLITIIF